MLKTNEEMNKPSDDAEVESDYDAKEKQTIEKNMIALKVVKNKIAEIKKEAEK